MSEADFDRLVRDIERKMQSRREVIRQADGEIKIRVFPRRKGGINVKIEATL